MFSLRNHIRNFGNDAATYRSAVNSGRHHLMTLDFDASALKKGTNTISFTMSGNGSNGGFMYDCIKLEAGKAISNGISDVMNLNKEIRGNDVFYNLNGQRVKNYTKGLYIVNGKKVFLK